MNVVIIGAGGHGKVVMDILRRDADVKLIGFLDDDTAIHAKVFDGLPVLGGTAALPELMIRYKLDGGVIAIGDNNVRARFFEKLRGLGLKPKSAIHAHALIARDVEIGEGVVIAAGAIVNTRSRIGDDVIINTGAVIDHESVIASHSHISPGVTLGGHVSIGQYTHIGLGATVIQELTVGEHSTVGAGAVVVADIPANATAVGVPARIIKQNGQAGPSEHQESVE